MYQYQTEYEEYEDGYVNSSLDDWILKVITTCFVLFFFWIQSTAVFYANPGCTVKRGLMVLHKHGFCNCCIKCIVSFTHFLV